MNIQDKDMEYIGDGVYARYDGYGVWLAANHHENEVVYLEPVVLNGLVEFFQRKQNELTAERQVQKEKLIGEQYNTGYDRQNKD